MATSTRPPIGNEHIDRFLDDVRGLKSEGTWKARHSDLKHFYKWLDSTEKGEITDLSALDIRSYLIQNANEGYAPKTIQSRYQSLYALYNSLAGIYDVLDANPIEKNLDYNDVKELMEGTKKTDDNGNGFIHVTPEEVDLMAEHASKPRTRNQLILRLLFQTGVRVQECRDMKLEDTNPDSRSINVYSKKTKEWRTVYWQPSLDTLMSLWLNQLRETYAPANESDYLFLTNRSKKLGKSRMREMVRDVAENAGIQDVLYTDPAGKDHHRVTPHAFRHGHCMHAIKQDIDIAFVSEHAGHSSLDMTKRYLEAIENDVQDAYNRFEA